MSVEIWVAVAFSAVIVISPYLFRRKNNRASLQSTAVSFGILGTFFGIFMGMIQFKTGQAMQQSIDTLLEGLRIAFLTPIVGMTVALIIKNFPQVYGLPAEVERNSAEEHLTVIHSELLNINKSLSGSEEGTLLANIKLQRAELADKLTALNVSFNEFAAKVVEDNKTQLIEALKEVIRDFNARINEQFGENFRHLNEGVGKMLEWQRQYGEQVEMATKALIAADNSLTTSADALKKSTDNSVSYLQLAKQMENHISILGKSLTEIEDISTSASKAFQEMHKTMDDLQTNIVENANEIMTSNTEHVEKMSRELETNNQTFLRTANEANQKLLQTMTDSAKKLQDQVTKLDDQLGQELNKSLSTLGTQLTSLSGRFVEDYAQLAERLRIVFTQLNVK